MRTTVDLPPVTHRRVKALAHRRGVSVSAVISDLTRLGLASIEEEPAISISSNTGLPFVDLGHVVTTDEVAEALDDE